MLTLRTVLASDKKTIGVSSVNSNLTEVPGWVEGESLVLSSWNVRLDTPTGNVELTNLSYPIEVHHDFGSTTQVTLVHLYRSIGANELYINIQPVLANCTVFDARIEFLYTEEED